LLDAVRVGRFLIGMGADIGDEWATADLTRCSLRGPDSTLAALVFLAIASRRPAFDTSY
jgi:hypothetical protein